MNRKPNHNILLIVGKENLAESVNYYPLRPTSETHCTSSPGAGRQAVSDKQYGYCDKYAASDAPFNWINTLHVLNDG
jgi:hypothetical protein